MQPRIDIHARAQGRWRALLPQMGVPVAYLVNRHGPCPLCGGKDRFRFDDREGKGTWICTQCGAGNGVDLVMAVKGMTFPEARDLLAPLVGSAAIELPKRAPVRDNRHAVELWASGRPLSGLDAASKYLQRRAISIDPPPREVRAIDRVTYHWLDAEGRPQRTIYAGMLARFVAPDAKTWTVQVTYLTSAGERPEIENKRKTMGPMPVGGAVRLATSAETMGVAEGVETALSAAKRFGVPTWACLQKGELIKFQPPPTCKALLIFGDNDANFTGAAAAYALAHKLKIERRDGLHVEVRIPDDVGSDWNDVVRSEAA